MVRSEAASCAEHVGSCSFLPAVTCTGPCVLSSPLGSAAQAEQSTQKDVEFLLGQGTLQPTPYSE